MAVAEIVVTWRSSHIIEVPDNLTAKEVESNLDLWADEVYPDVYPDAYLDCAEMVDWECRSVVAGENEL